MEKCILVEIFLNEKLTFKEHPNVVIKEVQKEVDWVDYMDAEAMKDYAEDEGGRVRHHQ